MIIKTTEISEFIDGMKEPIIKDWTAQHKRDQRSLKFSERTFGKEVKANATVIKHSNILKKAYQYHRANVETNGAANREMTLFELEDLFKVLFVDLKVSYGWPELAAYVKKAFDGRYYHMIEEYVVNSKSYPDRIASPSQVSKMGAEKEAPYYIQLAQLATRAKRQFFNDQEIIEDLKDKVASKEDALERKQLVQARILAKIEKIEELLKQPHPNSDKIKQEIEILKQNVF